MSKKWDIFILVLSLYVIAVLAVEVITSLSQRTIEIIDAIDFMICMIFIGDWIYFYKASPKKKDYVKSRLIDLIASVPFIQVFRLFRVFRIVRIVRAFRVIRGMKGVFPILRVITKNKRRSILITYLACTILVYFYCTLGFMHFEKGVNDGIRNFGDAAWMAFTTVTTIGYGDIYPKTTEGRVMAGVLVMLGMGLFSLVTAEFASFFMDFLKEECNNREA